MTIQVSSPAFSSNGSIPPKYSCAGEDVAPALEWSGVPANARSLALILDDPDAPSGTFTHWLVFDMPAATSSLPEGGVLPAGAQHGRNDFHTNAYGGPCPPAGKPHHYHFKVFALDQTLAINAGASRKELVDAMSGHILAQGELVGTFAR